MQYFHEALSHNSVAVQQDSNVKSQFIQNCIDLNIKYVDMESGYFSAFCHKLNVSGVAIVGIEYDIAAPSSDSMRVSHAKALQATLDVFCQYLWDRVSQDTASMKQQAQSAKVRVRSKVGVRDYDDDEDEVISAESAAMAKVQSYGNDVQMEDRLHAYPTPDVDDQDVIPKAAFNPDLIAPMDNENEGS